MKRKLDLDDADEKLVKHPQRVQKQNNLEEANKKKI